MYLNVDIEHDPDNAKPPVSGKQDSKASVNDIMDEYPEEYDDEEEENVYNNEPSEQNLTKYKVPIADLKNVICGKRKGEGFKNEYEVSMIVYVYQSKFNYIVLMKEISNLMIK